jgi:hypothetical protein
MLTTLVVVWFFAVFLLPGRPVAWPFVGEIDVIVYLSLGFMVLAVFLVACALLCCTRWASRIILGLCAGAALLVGIVLLYVAAAISASI